MADATLLLVREMDFLPFLSLDGYQLMMTMMMMMRLT
jgi:hypothetical protein